MAKRVNQSKGDLNDRIIETESNELCQIYDTMCDDIDVLHTLIEEVLSKGVRELRNHSREGAMDIERIKLEEFHAGRLGTKYAAHLKSAIRASEKKYSRKRKSGRKTDDE